jgi:hypothetical protein
MNPQDSPGVRTERGAKNGKENRKEEEKWEKTPTAKLSDAKE